VKNLVEYGESEASPLPQPELAHSRKFEVNAKSK
jgi:hypothetical protein